MPDAGSRVRQLEGPGRAAGRLPLAFWGAASWLAVAAFALATSTLIFRRLGPETFGLWATLSSLRGFLLFLDGGLAFGVTRDVVLADARDEQARLRLASASLMYVVAGVMALAIGLAGAATPGALLGLGGQPLEAARLATAWFAVDAAILLASAPLAGLLRGRERLDLLALVNGGQALGGLLLLSLVPGRWGLAGVTASLALVRLAAVAATWLLLQPADRRLLTWTKVDRRAVRQVAAFASPLWIIAAGTQLGLGTDVPLVGAFHGAVLAGHYALGAALPALCVGLLFALLDAYFPRMAASEGKDSEALVAATCLAGCLLAGLGFGSLALHRGDLLVAWVGTSPGLATRVAAWYSAAWALNVPAHVLVLVAIARASHRLAAPLVLVEACASLGVGFLLVRWRPDGPAIATLVVLAASNLVILPFLLLRRLQLGWRGVLRACGKGYGAGGAASLLVWAAAAPFAGAPPLRLAVVVLGTVSAAALLLTRAFRPAAFQTALNVVFLGGWRVLLRMRSEGRQQRVALEKARRTSPLVWVPEKPPLVTVRIATYSRGQLVADRAIASALAQTHAHLEVLVVGDHCDEATARAVRAVRDPRVRFENLPERGRYPDRAAWRWMVAGAAPMNRALELARGEWLAPLDDDDEFTPDHVEALLDACRTRDLEFAYGQADMEVAPGRWEVVGSWPLRQGAIIHAAVLYSSRLLGFRHAIDAWRINQPGDWNLWRRMQRCGVRMGFLERVVCRHYLEARDVGGHSRPAVRAPADPRPPDRPAPRLP